MKTRALRTLTALGLTTLALAGCGSAFRPASAGEPGQVAKASDTVAADASHALTLLAEIPAKGRAPKTGYSRAAFGQAWKDLNHVGCDVRNQLLKASLREVKLKAGTHGCVVLSGKFQDPYTGKEVSFVRGNGALADVDHIAALQDVWVKGAQSWTAEKRQQFAVDPANLVLVSAKANRAKGSADLATWLPPNRAYWCEYAARTVVVKAKYGVWMTPAEHRRAEQILTGCSGKK